MNPQAYDNQAKPPQYAAPATGYPAQAYPAPSQPATGYAPPPYAPPPQQPAYGYAQSGYYGQPDTIPPATGYNVQTVQPGLPPNLSAGTIRIPYTTPVDDIYPLIGLGIFQFSFYGKWPSMIGCACINTTLCCSNQQFTCVPTEEPNPMQSACICNRTNCECCHPVTTFTKFQVI
jgi:hypothetical protein